MAFIALIRVAEPWSLVNLIGAFLVVVMVGSAIYLLVTRRW